jgi:O-antigen ligase
MILILLKALLSPDGSHQDEESIGTAVDESQQSSLFCFLSKEVKAFNLDLRAGDSPIMKPVSDKSWSVCRLGSGSKSSSAFLLWLLVGYVALVPSLSMVPGVGLYNEKRALQIGILVVVAGVLIVSRSGRQRWLSTFTGFPFWARLGLGTVLGLGLLSSALAPASFYAFLEVGHFVLLFVAVGVVASELRRAPQWTQRVLLGAVAVSGVLYAVYFATGYGMHLAIADIKLWPEGGTNYINIRSFNQFQTWTLPLFAGVLLSLPQHRWVGKGVIFGLMSLWWALVFASNVRGTIVAMGVAAVGVGLLFRGRAKKWLIVQALALLAGLSIFYVLFTGGAPPVTEKFGSGSSNRLEHWQRCLELSRMHPWLGIGPMHFAWPPYQFTEPTSPHSALMKWLTEWGIPSALIMMGIVIWAGWRWIQNERRIALNDAETSNAVGVALVAAVLAGATHSMVSGLLVTPLSQMVFAFVGGWAWGRYYNSDRSPDRSASVKFSARSHALVCVLLVGAMGVVGASLKDLSTVEERRLAFRDAVEDNRFAPRYWTQGYIGVRDSSVIKRARRDR